MINPKKARKEEERENKQMGPTEDKSQRGRFKTNHIIHYSECKWTKPSYQTEGETSAMAEGGGRLGEEKWRFSIVTIGNYWIRWAHFNPM